MHSSRTRVEYFQDKDKMKDEGSDKRDVTDEIGYSDNVGGGCFKALPVFSTLR